MPRRSWCYEIKTLRKEKEESDPDWAHCPCFIHAKKQGQAKCSDISIAIHRHALRVTAKLPVGRRTNGPAATRMAASSTALLECQKLLSTECLVVNLACRLDKVLKMGAGKEVSEIDEFAVILILHVDDTPAVLAAANLLAIDDDRSFATNYSEWNDVLHEH